VGFERAGIPAGLRAGPREIVSGVRCLQIPSLTLRACMQPGGVSRQDPVAHAQGLYAAKWRTQTGSRRSRSGLVCSRAGCPDRIPSLTLRACMRPGGEPIQAPRRKPAGSCERQPRAAPTGNELDRSRHESDRVHIHSTDRPAT
jgi:hypothetical protein